MAFSSPVRKTTLIGIWNNLCLRVSGTFLQSISLWLSFTVDTTTAVGFSCAADIILLMSIARYLWWSLKLKRLTSLYLSLRYILRGVSLAMPVKSMSFLE